MRKISIIVLFISFLCFNKVHSQSLIISAKGGFVLASSVDSEFGAMFTASVENKFNKFLALGINGKFGGADYVREISIWENNILVEERELVIYNSAYAVNIYPKISFITTDELILSLIPEVGLYWTKSRPVIYFTDNTTGQVIHENYDTKWSNRNLALGLHLEGQYYLSERLSVLASIGWNNYNTGKSSNNVDLEGNWESKISENINFLYFEIGISYSLFGKNIW